MPCANLVAEMQWTQATGNIRSKTLTPSVSYLAQWLDDDDVVTIVNCRQHGDYTAIGSSVTVLPAVVNSHYTIVVQSLCSHCA